MNTSFTVWRYAIGLGVALISSLDLSAQDSTHAIPVGSTVRFAFTGLQQTGRSVVIDSVLNGSMYLAMPHGVRVVIPAQYAASAHLAMKRTRVNGAIAGARVGLMLGLALAPAVAAGVFHGQGTSRESHRVIGAIGGSIVIATGGTAVYGFAKRITRWTRFQR